MNDNWKEAFAPQILARGRKYFEESRVRCIQLSGNTYTATVTDTEDYTVTLDLKYGSLGHITCDCPYAADPAHSCEHMAAVLFALEYRILGSPTQPGISAGGKRIVRYFYNIPCYICDGEWVPFPMREHLYYDFIEQTAAYQAALPVIEQIIKEALGERYGCFGSCHAIWRQQKQLLLEKYGIEWFSPAELNQAVCFD